MPKDIELEVLHPQALQDIRTEAARKVELANRAAAKAEVRARDAESTASVRTEGERAALRRVGDQIRHSPSLYPWMRAYAEWITVGCVEPPKISSRLSKARGFARAPVSSSQLKLLEARPDYITSCKDLESGSLERARARFAAAFPEYVDAHREALDLARDAADYNAIARITEPVLDRVIPKKSDAVAAAQVTVVLAPEQMKAIATYEAPPVLVEAVAEPEPAE